jgi:hypothetical protein
LQIKIDLHITKIGDSSSSLASQYRNGESPYIHSPISYQHTHRERHIRQHPYLIFIIYLCCCARQSVRFFLLTGTLIPTHMYPGLPCAPSLSPAFTTKRMTCDNFLVRALGVCDTLPNANVVCTGESSRALSEFRSNLSAISRKTRHGTTTMSSKAQLHRPVKLTHESVAMISRLIEPSSITPQNPHCAPCSTMRIVSIQLCSKTVASKRLRPVLLAARTDGSFEFCQGTPLAEL